MNYAESSLDGVLLRIRVQPRASRRGLAEIREGDLRVCLQSPPLDDRANLELLSYLAKVLNCPKRTLHLVSGKKSRDKVVRIENLSLAEVCRQLESLL